ncbi:MAG: prephenate dehydrogenase/arogenate dehydrogenase family protein [Candidatus Omnitrophica bacterium]|nr:prephenate dehydrogenase/arogenate dehydrogenase family protein [Candidatus Omnitrophota bacterium]
MKEFKKIAILGVGLIGGSIGLAVKKKGAAQEIRGLTTKRSTLAKALCRKAIDSGTLSLKKAVSGADLVIICTPVKMVSRIIKKILPYLKKGCLITDVASTKGEIVEEVEKILPSGVSFVGGHPMAGSERTGVEFARAGLFEGSVCIVTKSKRTTLNDLKKISAFWRKLGAKVKVLTPGRHDEIVARISHLPHLAAVALVNELNNGDTDFVSSGFRDTTRISSSSAKIWRDICLSNRRCISLALDGYIRRMKVIKKEIDDLNGPAISREFKKAKTARKMIKG